MFRPKFGTCVCGCAQSGIIVVKAGYLKRCNERIKNEKKSEHKKTYHDTIKTDRIGYLFGKQNNIAKMKDDLDNIFSMFIRLRNADNNGMVKCFTSGKVFHWKSIQAGHFISRRHLATRWDEKNVQPQSVAENMYNQGNAPVFAKRLDEKYGENTSESLLIKSRNRCEMSPMKYKLLIKTYTDKVSELKIKLNIA